MSSAISTPTTSRVGRTVMYKLTDHDAKAIVQSRLSAGRGTVTGNEPREGDEYPALIIRDWAQHDDKLKATIDSGEYTISGRVMTWEKYLAQASVNLQVFLDGTDVYWATSRSQFDPELHGTYEKRDLEEVKAFLGVEDLTMKHLQMAVAEYQRKHHLNPDGVWGTATDAVAVRSGDLPAMPFTPDAKGHWFEL